MAHKSESIRRAERFYSSWNSWVADEVAQAYYSRLAEMDVGLRIELKSILRRGPLFELSRMKGGSGFRMAETLRSFFLEYLHRILGFGPNSLPSSFNIVEAFLDFHDEFKVFDLRQEEDHLLLLNDYLDWYTSDRILSDDSRLLIDTMKEGVIYSFDLIGDTGGYVTSDDGSRLAIVGISMIRHKDDISVILLSGESPSYPPVGYGEKEKKPIRSREGMTPHPDLSTRDRYLEGMDDFSRIILLTRIDLRSRKHEPRYVNVDFGKGYMVGTDDTEMLSRTFDNQLDPEAIQDFLEESQCLLKRYDQLFSAAASLLYLPIMFVDQSEFVLESRFVTHLWASKNRKDVRNAIKEFGRNAIASHRVVRCLHGTCAASSCMGSLVSTFQTIDPPELKFESTGYWKPLGANEIGEDKNGNPIVAKTWVNRMETYSARSLDSFVVCRSNPIIGEDPGVIYVARSPSHGIDLYKIGLTRRSARERVTELGSSTGVPLPFEVLASWNVGNCSAIEKAVHYRLSKYRVNKRREFFNVGLPEIVKAVQQAICQLETDDRATF